MADSPILVCDVLHIDEVAGFSMSSTEIGITRPIWALDFDNEAINEQYDPVVVCLLRMIWVLERLLQLGILIGLWQLDISAA